MEKERPGAASGFQAVHFVTKHARRTCESPALGDLDEALVQNEDDHGSGREPLRAEVRRAAP